jgi:hypothetical protein
VRVRTLTIPYSGQLLVAHLAAYGLGFVLDAGGEEVFVGHDPYSLEMEPQVSTAASFDRIAECVRNAAAECQEPIEADLVPGKTGNDRRPVVWARATAMARATDALRLREGILDDLERRAARVAAGTIAGLGAPAAWLGDHPERGASRLDGVLGNHTSDFVRGVMRRTRRSALSAAADGLEVEWMTGETTVEGDTDRTGWVPPGTKIDPLHQWLAALGLSQLPVGLSADGPATTPCHWRDGRERGATLPILSRPVSMPRLRALLQLPDLTLPAAASVAARLRALGVHELVSFSIVDRSTPQSVAFTFTRGNRSEL